MRESNLGQMYDQGRPETLARENGPPVPRGMCPRSQGQLSLLFLPR